MNYTSVIACLLLCGSLLVTGFPEGSPGANEPESSKVKLLAKPRENSDSEIEQSANTQSIKKDDSEPKLPNTDSSNAAKIPANSASPTISEPKATIIPPSLSGGIIVEDGDGSTTPSGKTEKPNTKSTTISTTPASTTIPTLPTTPSTPSPTTPTPTTPSTTPVPATTSASTTVPTSSTPSSTTEKPTTIMPTTTKPPMTTVAPETARRFDGPSFIGGIVFALGFTAIGFVAWKFYKARTERNYHTL